jgi:ElaA protein
MSIMTAITWHWYAFSTMSPDILYAVLRLRQEVFVVEQQCAYLDCDNRDQEALHLIGWDGEESALRPVAYLRLSPPLNVEQSPALGRVLTHPGVRHLGIGREMLARGLKRIKRDYPKADITISAQQYLTAFYQGFGFTIASEGYEEDGIPHIRMIRPGR